MDWKKKKKSIKSSETEIQEDGNRKRKPERLKR